MIITNKYGIILEITEKYQTYMENIQIAFSVIRIIWKLSQSASDWLFIDLNNISSKIDSFVDLTHIILVNIIRIY